MGFNTGVVICNDNLADYLCNPERFAKIICGGALKHDGANEWGITVVQADHADATQLVAVGNNGATKVYTSWIVGSHHTEEGRLKLLAQWADSLGYRLVKKTKRKAKL